MVNIKVCISNMFNFCFGFH